jgi:DNA-binding NarL/FixJ family response regulator
MSYIKATDVLPKELLDLIQKYVEGEYIYIPKKECNRKLWGENTKSKVETSARNTDIYKIYEEGVSVKIISEMYYLSSKSIQKIVLKIKKENE